MNLPTREIVLEVLQLAGDRVRTSGQDPAAAIASACTTKGISPREYEAVVHGDADLTELERLALKEAAVGSTDPGPYGSISRESMSGKPGDTTKSRSHPEPSRH